jgi:hypothetical protein
MRSARPHLAAIGLALFAIAAWPIGACAQQDTMPEPPASHHAINLTAGGVGISIGNSRAVTGIRLNLVDHQVERVTGLNLTLWVPKRNPELVVTGAAVGLVGPRAKRIEGVALGGVGVYATERLDGVSAGGLMVLSRNEINGIAAGGLATVAAERLRGIGVAGLATVGDHGIDGLAAAGLVTLSEGNVNGVTSAVVGTITEGRHTGINLAGGGTFTDGEMRGIDAAGIATVVRGPSRGIQAAGGIAAATHLQGIGVAAGSVRVEALDGLAISAWNNVRGPQRGLTIGIFNYARSIRGVQLGLLNYVRSNPRGLRLLPVFNTAFR